LIALLVRLFGNAYDYAHALARFLDQHFKIHPTTLRRKKEGGKEQRLKGYQRADFEEVWERYLPPLEADGDTAKEPIDQDHVTLQSNPKARPTRVSPNKNAACHDVTLQKSTPEKPSKPQPQKQRHARIKSFSRLKNIVSKAFASAFQITN